MSYSLFGRKLYPDLKENLEQFRAHLKEGAHEMAPLKVWQLQGTCTLHVIFITLGCKEGTKCITWLDYGHVVDTGAIAIRTI